MMTSTDRCWVAVSRPALDAYWLMTKEHDVPSAETMDALEAAAKHLPDDEPGRRARALAHQAAELHWLAFEANHEPDASHIKALLRCLRDLNWYAYCALTLPDLFKREGGT